MAIRSTTIHRTSNLHHMKFPLLQVALFLAGTLTLRAGLPPLPQPVTSFGAASVGNAVFIYGGNSGQAHEFHRDCIKGDLFSLKVPDGTQWEALPGGTALLGASMTTHAGLIYRIGGMEARNAKGEKNDLRSTSEVARFDPAAQRWETFPPLPEPRSSHDTAVLGDTLFVAGGWKLTGGRTGEWHRTLLTFDLRAPEKGWQSQPQPFARRALAVVAHNQRVWFLGGMDEHDEPSRAVDWFDPKTGEWGKGPELPDSTMAGFGMAACNANGKLLASPLSGKVHLLSTDLQRWEDLTTLARPRFFHRLLPMPDGNVLAVGGSSRKEQILEPEMVSLVPKEQPAPEKGKGSSRPGAPESAASWPQWRGPQRDGISRETHWLKNWQEEAPRVLWHTQVGAGMSSCAVADGRLLTQGNDGHGNDSVVALDAATGAELWRYSFPCASSAHEMPIVPSGPGATPTVAGGHVFALSREGDFLCLEANSGRLAWRKNLVSDLGGKRPVYGYTQSPLIDSGLIFLDVGRTPGQTGSTIALDVANGEIQWRSGTGEAGYSSARMMERDGRRLVAMFKGEALDLFDPADGRVLFSHRTTARDFTNAATPAFLGHRVLISNTGTDLATLLDWDLAEEPNARPAWTHKQFSLLFNSAIVHDGCLFGFNEKRRGHHEFTCIDGQTGDTRWVSDAVPTSTFILADGHWIFLTRDGELLLAAASTAGLKPSARFKAVEGKCYASPVLADRRLYVRSNAGEMVAFDLRPGAGSS